MERITYAIFIAIAYGFDLLAHIGGVVGCFFYRLSIKAGIFACKIKMGKK